MNQNLDNLRHSCAHLLAKAVLELWPGSHNAIGPAIESGFYQDFDMGDVKISESDLPKIEARMKNILSGWTHFEYKEVSVEEARKLFAHNPYKLELIEEFAKEGKKLLTNNPGNFLDLCKMTHVENPAKEMQYFKLLSVAGAYWRGSEKNKMLTRIYGTVWPTQKELDHYLWQLEEAKKRDHRKIGRELDLFLVSQDIGGGLPIFTPKGKLLRDAVENYIVQEKKSRGYQFVWTPHIARSEIYKQSGHWQKYDAMFNPMKLEDEDYVLKPMNCPHHFQVYLNQPHSYRDLPMRIAENGTCYRYEKSGELNGLLRVRSVTIDDTHTFVRHDQIAAEIDAVLDLIETVFKAFGFPDYHARVSIRDQNHPEKYLGKPKIWAEAEKALIAAVEKRNISYFLGAGEAAFYGPKIDVMVKDSLGRDWQLSTCQLDFNQPENFDMTYTGKDSQSHRPAVLHIAILGSLERFLGILIEHYAGAFPVWLAPVQIVILPVSEKHLSFARGGLARLNQAGIRAELDDRAESLPKRIRQAELQKIPYMLIVGDREAELSSVSVRQRGEKDLGSMPLDQFLNRLNQEIDSKAS